jgi:hypothetical protein
MQGPTGKGSESVKGSPTHEDLQAVKDVIASFLIALKNSAIYPEDHAICQKGLENVKIRLDGFLGSYGDLTLDVEKDRFLFQGEVVHQGAREGGNLPFFLFRDGIQWLKFQRGLELWEIKGFCKILNQYREQHEEPEGDLVTALWEAQFPHLRYKALEVFWEAEPLGDLSALTEGDTARRGMDRQEEEQDIPVITALPTMDDALWKLTPEEMRKLRGMILEEQNRDSTEDMVEVLLIILNGQCEQGDFVVILEFLKEEFHGALGQGEFRFAFKLLRGLDAIRQTCKIERHWALPLLDNFFKAISRPGALGVLNQVWPTLDILDSDRMGAFRHVLLLLPPEAILALGPLLLEIHSPQIQRQLMEIIGSLATRDLRPLEQLLDRPEESLVGMLVDILGHLKGEKTTRILLKMIHHPSERVRSKALKALAVRGPEILAELFPLIEDPSDGIRRRMLEYLGQRRSELAEGLLLGYLEGKAFRRKDYQHTLACYRALGRCGSPRCIPLLRRMLLDRGWIPGFGRSMHRHCAAIALNTLGMEEAKQILEKASRSIFPSVRRAYRKAMEGNR